MREIKFRAYNTKTNRMIDPHVLTPLALNNDCRDMKGVFLAFHEEVELMQYTGLKDKNGKEIYEGDIIKGGHHNYLITYVSSEVRYEATLKQAYILACEWKTKEIIGNIYENPELLR